MSPARTFTGIITLLIFNLSLFAQGDDYTWWNNKHNWDGVTHWTKYLVYSPAYFGPNALPVPEIRQGMIDSRPYLETGADLHFSKGDDTQNLFLKFSYPFFDGRVALEVFGVPLEHFIMDTVTRDERAGRDIDAEGFAAGDLYISTLVQLARDRGSWPDILLGITLRTASGGNLSNARYTDAPGYYFDLSMGKSFSTGEKITLRPYLLAGFYAWQTNGDDHLQNDAFLYGAGLSVSGNTLEGLVSYGGYKGYIGNGDAPMVLRANIVYKLNKTRLKLSFQQGLQDFGYNMVSMGSLFYLK